jgi:hypothetical protein
MGNCHKVFNPQSGLDVVSSQTSGIRLSVRNVAVLEHWNSMMAKQVARFVRGAIFRPLLWLRKLTERGMNSAQSPELISQSILGPNPSRIGAILIPSLIFYD